MKVLLVNHTLADYAGSETFTYALALELTRLGHDVTCFSPRRGCLVPPAAVPASTRIIVTNHCWHSRDTPTPR